LILTAADRALSQRATSPRIPELWDGHTADRIATVVRERVPAV